MCRICETPVEELRKMNTYRRMFYIQETLKCMEKRGLIEKVRV